MNALPPSIKCAVFDMAGTTVDDVIDGEPLVSVAMRAAFAQIVPELPGGPLDATEIDAVRGLEKRDALKRLYVARQQSATGADEVAHCSQSDDVIVQELYSSFKKQLVANLPRLQAEIEGASQCFAALRQRGVKVFVGSGFPPDAVDTIVGALGWEGKIDGSFSSASLGHGRPHPAMIHEAMRRSGLDPGSQEDARTVVKIGDTVADVEEGHNAKCWVVAVCTGTQPRSKLAAARPPPHFIVPSVANVPELFSAADAR